MQTGTSSAFSEEGGLPRTAGTGATGVDPPAPQMTKGKRASDFTPQIAIAAGGDHGSCGTSQRGRLPVPGQRPSARRDCCSRRTSDRPSLTPLLLLTETHLPGAVDRLVCRVVGVAERLVVRMTRLHECLSVRVGSDFRRVQVEPRLERVRELRPLPRISPVGEISIASCTWAMPRNTESWTAAVCACKRRVSTSPPAVYRPSYVPPMVLSSRSYL